MLTMNRGREITACDKTMAGTRARTLKATQKATRPPVVYTTAWQRYLQRLRRLVWAR